MKNNDDKPSPIAETIIEKPKQRLDNGPASNSRKLNSTAFVESMASKSHSNFANNTSENNISVSSSEDLKPGCIINQRFRLQKRIGQGGMGTIFLAVDCRKEELGDSDPYTAIKFLNSDLHDSMEAIVALQREAKKSQTLSHPNIVTVYDFDRQDALVFLSMEYLRGESFDRYISRSTDSKESIQQRIEYIVMMGQGLAYAHQEGFVHADFKPANVFLTKQGQVKVLDFGIAQVARTTQKAHTNSLARTNPEIDQNQDSLFDPANLGATTPSYASLEMLEGQRPLPCDDVYALAVVAYELLSGKHPFLSDGDPLTAQQAYKNSSIATPIQGVSKHHMSVIYKGLSFKRCDRYDNANEFINALKPKVSVSYTVISVISLLVLIILISWGVNMYKADAMIGFNNLSDSMATVIDTIKTADEIFSEGDIDQAHKLYVQAWESRFDHVNADSRDHFKLKIILDRRVNDVILDLISRTKTKNIDPYALMQLELALEFLRKDDLGTIDDEIDRALKRIKIELEHK